MSRYSSGEATYSYVISQSVGYKLKSILHDIVNKIRKMHDLFESVHELESQDGDDSADIKLKNCFFILKMKVFHSVELCK